MSVRIHLDGSHGEGGGQILRTAAALSVLTGRPFEMVNVRANRPKPGLRPQHAGALRFLATATGGRVEGAEVGSSAVRFTPGMPRPGTYRHDIGTAGSISLFLQAVLPVYLLTRGTSELVVRGGTDVSHAPLMDWYTGIYVPYVAPLARRIEVEVVRRGFYPAGGGEVRVRIEAPDAPEPQDVDLLRQYVADRLGRDRTGSPTWSSAAISSIAADGLRPNEVARRQADAAASTLRRRLLFVPHQTSAYGDTLSLGSSVAVIVRDDAGNAMGADALGERGVRAETVGQQAAQSVLDDLETGAAVDRHMADQVVPWVALGAGAVRVPRMTGHLETNIAACRAFLGDDAVRLDDHVVRPCRSRSR